MFPPHRSPSCARWNPVRHFCVARLSCVAKSACFPGKTQKCPGVRFPPAPFMRRGLSFRVTPRHRTTHPLFFRRFRRFGPRTLRDILRHAATIRDRLASRFAASCCIDRGEGLPLKCWLAPHIGRGVARVRASQSGGAAEPVVRYCLYPSDFQPVRRLVGGVAAGDGPEHAYGGAMSGARAPRRALCLLPPRPTACPLGPYSVVALVFVGSVRLAGMKVTGAVTTARPWVGGLPSDACGVSRVGAQPPRADFGHQVRPAATSRTARRMVSGSSRFETHPHAPAPLIRSRKPGSSWPL